MGVLILLGAIINVLLLGFITRRLLGVPVGWPRTIVVAAVLAGAVQAVVGLVVTELGFVGPEGTFTSDIHPAVAAAIMILVAAWTVAMGVGALVVIEALVPTGTLPRPLTVLRDLPARRRRTRRYTQIVAIAARHGLGGFLRPAPRRLEADDAPQVARSLRLAMTDAGVTFVKLGQMLSTRPDLVGTQFAAELGRLTSEVEPQDWSVVEQTLARELGAPPDQVFAEVDPVPLAAASVGQVHRGRLAAGTAVVIKVQRSDARAQVSADVDILRRLATWLERTTGWGQALRVRSLVDGFAANLDEELDYRVEAANARAIAGAADDGGRGAGDPRTDDDGRRAGADDDGGDGVRADGAGSGMRVRIPQVYEQWSGPRVLVMEELSGTPLARASQVLAGRSGPQRAAMARALLDAVLRQVLQVGVFHADLHAGNVYLCTDGSLGLLDFGSVGRLDRRSQAAVGQLLFAVDRGDSVAAVDALLELLDRPAGLDDRQLERDLGVLVVRYRGGAGAAGANGLFADLFALVINHGFAVPAQIAAAFRAFGALEGTLALLDPGVDLVTTAREAGRQIVDEQVQPGNLKATLEEQVAQVLPVLQRLPRHLDALGSAAHRGELSLNVRVLADPADRRFLMGLVHQVTTTLIAGFAAIGAILLVIADGGPMVGAGLHLYPLLGATLFLLSFILAARAVAVAFRHNAAAHWGARE